MKHLSLNLGAFYLAFFFEGFRRFILKLDISIAFDTEALRTNFRGLF